MNKNDRLFESMNRDRSPRAEWLMKAFGGLRNDLTGRLGSLRDFTARTLERLAERLPSDSPHFLVGVVSVLLVSLLATGLYLYGWYRHFDHLVEEKEPFSVLNTSGVYSRSSSLTPGQVWSRSELERVIRQSGYLLEEAEQEGSLGFQREGQRQARFEIRFEGAPEGQRINSIRRDAQELKSLKIPPLLLAGFAGKARTKIRSVEVEEMPDYLVSAILAAEDEDFYSHWGVDISSIFRAAWANLRSWGIEQGASTLTQQFVKNYYLSPERTLRRKIKEAILAFLLESRLTKEEILRLYATHVYLGQAGTFSIRGFAAAADAYFRKQVSDLTLAEAALLAGMLQAPNRYSPFGDVEAATARRNYVLSLMLEDSLIGRSEYEEALHEPIRAVSELEQEQFEAPYFLDYVRRQLSSSKYSELVNQDTSLEIQTTLDHNLQRLATQIVAEGVNTLEKNLGSEKSGEGLQGALVALDPRTGDILAMVGGRDYSRSQFNRAVDAYRQPGSTFKPFVYATALSPALTPNPFTTASLLLDAPFQYETEPGEEFYTPRNFSREYQGTVNLRNALALSINAPTVNLAGRIGFDRVAVFANQLGFKKRMKAFPSVALGTIEVSLLELAGAYTVFANDGRKTPIRTISQINAGGEHIAFNSSSKQILDQETAYLVTSILQSAIDWGTAASVRREGFRVPAAGKTGTSRDSWFVGYTPDLLVAVWVGYDDNRDLGLTGARAALPIWTRFMKRARQIGYLEGNDFQRPEGLVEEKIDPDTGMPALAFGRNSRLELFIEGTVPSRIQSPSATSSNLGFWIETTGEQPGSGRVNGAASLQPVSSIAQPDHATDHQNPLEQR